MRLIVQFLRINANPNASQKLPLANTLHLKVLHFLQSVDEGISTSLFWKVNEVSILSRKQVSHFAFIYMRAELAYLIFPTTACQNEKAHSMCPVMLSGHAVRPEMQACPSKPAFLWCCNWHALLLGPMKNATGDQCWMIVCVNQSSCGRYSWSVPHDYRKCRLLSQDSQPVTKAHNGAYFHGNAVQRCGTLHYSHQLCLSLIHYQNTAASFFDCTNLFRCCFLLCDRRGDS